MHKIRQQFNHPIKKPWYYNIQVAKKTRTNLSRDGLDFHPAMAGYSVRYPAEL